MGNFVREVFRALIELIGPVSSIALGTWFIAAFWHGFELNWWVAIPFTNIKMDPQGVRDLLIMGYMVVQALLVVDLYTMKMRGVQTRGRNFVEAVCSLFPIVVLVSALWTKQTGGFAGWTWDQSNNHMMILGFLAGLVDILLTWLTAAKPAAPTV